MNETLTPETEPAVPAKLDVVVRVYPSKTEGNPLAYASVTLGGCFAVKGIRVMDSEKGAPVPDTPQEASGASAPKKASKTRKADRGAR